MDFDRLRKEGRLERVEEQVHLWPVSFTDLYAATHFNSDPALVVNVEQQLATSLSDLTQAHGSFPKQLHPGRLSEDTAIAYWDIRKQREFDQEVIKPIKKEDSDGRKISLPP